MHKAMLLSLLDDCTEIRQLTPRRMTIPPTSVWQVMEGQRDGSHHLLVTTRLLLRWAQLSVEITPQLIVSDDNNQ